MIERLLVANRGEIASRIFRTCHALGIEAIAVHSDADADLPFVREADRAVRLPGNSPTETYLAIDRVLDAARRTDADAVHPGFGFLAENAGFARRVIEAGLTWVGPQPEAMEAMGEKAAARKLADANGVPIVPGWDGDDDDASLRAAAEEIGFPLLVKASAGGGGRGMRRVQRMDDLQDAIDGARREAESAFGSGRLLLERYVERPRHIEIQVLGDAHGDVVHLFERECSIQRRHQKIVEEAPSPVVTAELRMRMGEAAVRVAKAVQYQGAGTVEFLLDPDGQFYFLEMNTRLQVEHPVTELITGVDLVALQIAVAEGRPLPFAQQDLAIRGHAIEVRLYTEDPNRDYMPATGTLVRFDVPGGEGIRLDAGVEDGSVVSPHYDAMVAKLIAYGEDRAQANRRLQRALAGAWMPGVVNNLPLLREIAAHPAWQEGDLDTAFLTRHGLPTPPPLNVAQGAIGAVALGALTRRMPWPQVVPPGFRVEGAATEVDRFQTGADTVEVAWKRSADGLTLILRDEDAGSDTPIEVGLVGRDGDRLTLTIGGVSQTWRVVSSGGDRVEDGDVVYVHTGRSEAVVSLLPRFPAPAGFEDEPGTCSAPMPGTVTRVFVAVGDPVHQGQKLLVLEAMKMEHTLTAPDDGVVSELRVAPGDAVEQGAVLVRVEEAG